MRGSDFDFWLLRSPLQSRKANRRERPAKECGDIAGKPAPASRTRWPGGSWKDGKPQRHKGHKVKASDFVILVPLWFQSAVALNLSGKLGGFPRRASAPN